MHLASSESLRLRRAVLIIAGTCLLLLVTVPATLQTSQNRYLVLLGGTLIDGTGADPVGDAAMVIHDGHIRYAGPRQSIELPTAAMTVDLPGLTILPGFINAHVHQGLVAANLRAWARAGVTTVRDLGSNPHSLARTLQQLPSGPDHARVVAAGPLITVPGGYPIVPFGAGSALAVGTDAQARQWAERLLDDDGAGLLKLALERGSLFGEQIPVLPLQRARLLVGLAHGRGTVVSAHITAVEDIDLALQAGVDDLAHMADDRLLPRDLADRIVNQGVLWVPTLELWNCTGNRGIAVSNLQRFVEAGGTVALGTDYAGYSCNWQLGMPMTEIGLMQQAGMTNMQIIVAATRNGARACNLERQLGTLEKGKVADLLVVAGDPLSDLSSLEQVRLVMRDGVTIRNEISELQWLNPRRPGGRIDSPAR